MSITVGYYRVKVIPKRWWSPKEWILAKLTERIIDWMIENVDLDEEITKRRALGKTTNL